ncbi:MAG: CinA family protein [Dehalococcoidia bacterium]|nr:CinA family protein [Dehalococcoidia bacterium]
MPAFPSDSDPLAANVGHELLARSARFAAVETTAGGLIAARVLSVPGASNWFDRAYVAYSGPAKADLGVDLDILRTHGAVSQEAVTAMAEVVRERSGVAFVVAESGIAGPQGSRRSPKPVGAVAIAVAGPHRTNAIELQLAGSRVEVMQAIAEAALALLLEEIRALE